MRKGIFWVLLAFLLNACGNDSHKTNESAKTVIENFKNETRSSPDAKASIDTAFEYNRTRSNYLLIQGHWKLIRSEIKEQDGTTTLIEYKDNFNGLALKFEEMGFPNLRATILTLIEGKIESDIYVKNFENYRIIELTDHVLTLSTTPSTNKTIDHYFHQITSSEFETFKSIEINP